MGTRFRVALHNRLEIALEKVRLRVYQSSHVVSTELDNDLYFVNDAIRRSCGRDNGLNLGSVLSLNALMINMIYLDRSVGLSVFTALAFKTKALLK